MIFTWDENKRLLNLKNHQLDFADAEKVLSGDVIVFEDARYDYGEQRWVAIGMLEIVVVVVVHTETAEVIRIISMRKATRNEQRRFRKI